MSSKKLLKQIVDKTERTALQRLIERYNLQEFNVEIRNGHVSMLQIKFKNLMNIPPEVQSFLGLESLDLSRNHIASIEGLTPLINLGVLRLRDNKIKKISNLESLQKLQELDLADNQISEMENLFNLRTLETLDLSRNQIKEIKGIDYCAILRTLRLNDNPLNSMLGLQNLNNIEVLQITKANLTKIEGISHLTYLRELNLGLNHIQTLTGLEGLIHLRKLNLAENQIRVLENLEHLKELQEIVLNGNPLNAEDISYIGRPAKEVVAYCQMKLEFRQKSEQYRQSIKKDRFQHQVQVEKEAETIIQTIQETKMIRNQIQQEEKHPVTEANEVSEEENSLEENKTQPQEIENEEDRGEPNRVNKAAFIPERPEKDPYAMPTRTEPKLTSQPSFLSLDAPRKYAIDPPDNSFSTPRTNSKNPQAPSFVPGQQKAQVFLPLKENLVKHNLHFGSKTKANIKPEQIERVAQQDAEREIKARMLAAQQPNVFEQIPAQNPWAPMPVPNPEILPVHGQKFESEQEWLDFANQLLQSEDYKNALIAYRNTLQLNTRNLEAWINSGIAFNNRSDFRRSIRAFKQAIALDDKDALLWDYLGLGYYNSGEMEDAAKSFMEALNLDSNDAMAKEYLALIPSEFKNNINFIERQAELLALQSQSVEDKLLQQLEEFKRVYREITYSELLPYVYNPPTITDLPSLKHKITDLIIQNRLAAKLYLDHLEFVEETPQELRRQKVNIQDRFIMVKLLAFTNFSKLWLVEDRRTGERSVLKHIIFKGDFMRVKLVEQMALREIALLSKISSPYVIAIWDSFVGEYEGETGYFIQEPYYRFGTLDSRIRDIQEQFAKTSQLMDPRAILAVFIGILKGILGIHAAGIIHRDMKPANVIINTDQLVPAPEDIVIIDFGIATAPQEIAGTDFTIAGGCGTKGFSAPEQLEGPNVDYSADIYAVAATIYYTMTLNKYSGTFYIPEYVLDFYDHAGIGFVFEMLEKMLKYHPRDRAASPEILQQFIAQLESALAQLQ
jgi:tetratricopeptide (TPR) repeat protein